MKKKISGIYKIENLINHKVYIGQSKDIKSRFNQHKSAETNKHLKHSFEKYGIENFSFEIIKETYDRNRNYGRGKEGRNSFLPVIVDYCLKIRSILEVDSEQLH